MKDEDQTQEENPGAEAEGANEKSAPDEGKAAGKSESDCEEPSPDGSNEKKQAVKEEGAQKSEEKSQQQPDQQKEESSARVSNKSTEISDVKGSIVDNDISQQSQRDAVVANKYKKVVKNIYMRSGEIQAHEEEKSVFDFLTEFVSRPLRWPGFVPDDLQDYINGLKQDHLIVISCGNIEIALDVADRVLCSVNGNHSLPTSRIDLESKNLEGVDVSIDSFSKKKSETESPAAILVNVLGEKGREFLGSLFGDTSLSARIKKALNDNKLFLLCIAEREDVENRPKDHRRQLHFCHWNIGLLQPLLKHHIPEEYDKFEKQILAQRAQGKWGKTESEFCNGLLNALNDGKEGLEKEIDKRGSSSDVTLLESLFKSNEPITATALYVATFFPNLTPGEFRRVVKALLDGHKIRGPAHVTTNAEGISTQESEMIVLSEVWENEADSYLEKCDLEVFSTRDASRTIGLSNYGLRESFKQYLEKKHPLYLAKQFESVQQQGLLFDQSPRIAENVSRLIIEMAHGCPEDYGSDWIVSIVRKLQQQFDLWADEEKLIYSIFDGLKNFYGNRLGRGYTRISQWLRGMLDDSKLENVVSESLNRLMVPEVDISVLEIVKRIRFAPNFDDLYWVKQLFDRGGEEIRKQTFSYLYIYLRTSEMRIYEMLSRMHKWGIEDQKDTNSQSNLSGLRLLINYCINTIANFNPEHQGLWPSKYPLFSAADSKTAKDNMALLTSWLFHPGMKEALKQIDLDESINPLIAILISELVFILFGPGEQMVSETSAQLEAAPCDGANENGSESSISPAIMRDILIEEAASRASAVQQREFLEYWAFKRRELLMTRTQSKKEREEIQSRCRLLNDLMSSFKEATERRDSLQH